ncbi:hypothetical protein FACUT_13220 [Fusarium acutatum]|uniref:Uncharacterized protein n=1 Tax=Fusarium acutatum TaxID=78861 RepID=A0A8H4J9N3_9HYPO|nr:hypothetical protein FACUT_13220 [Fusarium acutatum]
MTSPLATLNQTATRLVIHYLRATIDAHRTIRWQCEPEANFTGAWVYKPLCPPSLLDSLFSSTTKITITPLAAGFCLPLETKNFPKHIPSFDQSSNAPTMSADQNNISSIAPIPGGGYRAVITDGDAIYPMAMRIMEETGANRVRIQLRADQPGVDNPTVYTAEIDHSGGFRFISRGPAIPSGNSNN